MPTEQGSLALLDDPVAQRLLQSSIPARLAYTWTDGTPRVVPIAFSWTGKELFFGTSPEAPKLKALGEGAKVAVTIDTQEFPYKVLMIRGRIGKSDVVPGIADEYRRAVIRNLGREAGGAWLGNMAQTTTEMARLYVIPEWVGILDFETRFPSYVERDMERAQAGVADD